MLNEFHVYGLSLAFRFALMLYGEWQDEYMEVKFTDVDYFVFSDAAEFVAAGESPYRRATYRYSPILAWLLIPNTYIHKVWGKFIFILFDLCTAIIINKILKALSCNKNVSLIAIGLWLFNPVTMTVSCRGNAESVLSCLVMGLIYALMLKKTVLAGLIFGTAVHMKIYPVIYSLSIFLFLGGNYDKQQGLLLLSDFANPFKSISINIIYKIFSKERVKFIFSSVSVFCALFCFMYLLYGFEFVEHTYLYHIFRRDVKHNFSVYFYMLYLNSSVFLNFLCFFNQFVVLVVISLVMYEDPPYCFFLLTQTFVTFNKICTSQYFLWYISLLPLVVPGFIHLKLKQVIFPVIFWFLGQAVWLFFAYLLEFRGINSFLYIWLSGIAFYLINVVIASWCVHYYRFHFLFTQKGSLNIYNLKTD